MKRLIIVLFMLFGALLSSQAQVDSTAKKVGNKTAELTVKGKSSVVDEVYKGKVGADGQSPIYIDHSSKYYYIDKRGKKVYVSKSSLKDKPKN
jgi:cytochrome oxidase Cu insertion factor (SCO1/SenC/PrrC family)